MNPAARGVKRRYLSRSPFWRAYLPDRCVRVTRTLEELDQAIVEFREADVRIVAVLGGDGTLHRLVDALLRHSDAAAAPAVLALAGGTMNGLARSLGSGGAPAPVLRAVVDALASGESPPVRTRRLLQVTDVTAGRTLYGFGFACGLVLRAFQAYYRDREPGIAAAIRASLLPITAAIVGGDFYDDLHLELVADGVSWLPEPPHTVVASVTDNPVLWFRPFGTPLGDAAAFHLVATSMRPGELAPRLWSVFRGRCRHPRLRVGQARQATVRADTGYLIDGDLYPLDAAGELRLAVGPSVRFSTPRWEEADPLRHPLLRESTPALASPSAPHTDPT